jgi:hypothetical protein
MKIGNIIQIKSRAILQETYGMDLFDEKMLVTDIIDDLALPDDIAIAIDGVVICVSESGIHRFPIEDVEVVNESR